MADLGPAARKKRQRILDQANVTKDYGALEYTFAEMLNSYHPLVPALQDELGRAVHNQFQNVYQSYMARHPSSDITLDQIKAGGGKDPIARSLFSQSLNSYLNIQGLKHAPLPYVEKEDPKGLFPEIQGAQVVADLYPEIGKIQNVRGAVDILFRSVLPGFVGNVKQLTQGLGNYADALDILGDQTIGVMNKIYNYDPQKSTFVNYVTSAAFTTSIDMGRELTREKLEMQGSVSFDTLEDLEMSNETTITSPSAFRDKGIDFLDALPDTRSQYKKDMQHLSMYDFPVVKGSPGDLAGLAPADLIDALGNMTPGEIDALASKIEAGESLNFSWRGDNYNIPANQDNLFAPKDDFTDEEWSTFRKHYHVAKAMDPDFDKRWKMVSGNLSSPGGSYIPSGSQRPISPSDAGPAYPTDVWLPSGSDSSAFVDGLENGSAPDWSNKYVKGKYETQMSLTADDYWAFKDIPTIKPEKDGSNSNAIAFQDRVWREFDKIKNSLFTEGPDLPPGNIEVFNNEIDAIQGVVNSNSNLSVKSLQASARQLVGGGSHSSEALGYAHSAVSNASIDKNAVTRWGHQPQHEEAWDEDNSLPFGMTFGHEDKGVRLPDGQTTSTGLRESNARPREINARHYFHNLASTMVTEGYFPENLSIGKMLSTPVLKNGKNGPTTFGFGEDELLTPESLDKAMRVFTAAYGTGVNDTLEPGYREKKLSLEASNKIRNSVHSALRPGGPKSKFKRTLVDPNKINSSISYEDKADEAGAVNPSGDSPLQRHLFNMEHREEIARNLAETSVDKQVRYNLGLHRDRGTYALTTATSIERINSTNGLDPVIASRVDPSRMDEVEEDEFTRNSRQDGAYADVMRPDPEFEHIAASRMMRYKSTKGVATYLNPEMLEKTLALRAEKREKAGRPKNGFDDPKLYRTSGGHAVGAVATPFHRVRKKRMDRNGSPVLDQNKNNIYDTVIEPGKANTAEIISAEENVQSRIAWSKIVGVGPEGTPVVGRSYDFSSLLQTVLDASPEIAGLIQTVGSRKPEAIEAFRKRFNDLATDLWIEGAGSVQYTPGEELQLLDDVVALRETSPEAAAKLGALFPKYENQVANLESFVKSAGLEVPSRTGKKVRNVGGYDSVEETGDVTPEPGHTNTLPGGTPNRGAQARTPSARRSTRLRGDEVVDPDTVYQDNFNAPTIDSTPEVAAAGGGGGTPAPARNQSEPPEFSPEIPEPPEENAWPEGATKEKPTQNAGTTPPPASKPAGVGGKGQTPEPTSKSSRYAYSGKTHSFEKEYVGGSPPPEAKKPPKAPEAPRATKKPTYYNTKRSYSEPYSVSGKDVPFGRDEVLYPPEPPKPSFFDRVRSFVKGALGIHDKPKSKTIRFNNLGGAETPPVIYAEAGVPPVIYGIARNDSSAENSTPQFRRVIFQGDGIEAATYDGAEANIGLPALPAPAGYAALAVHDPDILYNDPAPKVIHGNGGISGPTAEYDVDGVGVPVNGLALPPGELRIDPERLLLPSGDTRPHGQLLLPAQVPLHPDHNHPATPAPARASAGSSGSARSSARSASGSSGARGASAHASASGGAYSDKKGRRIYNENMLKRSREEQWEYGMRRYENVKTEDENIPAGKLSAPAISERAGILIDNLSDDINKYASPLYGHGRSIIDAEGNIIEEYTRGKGGELSLRNQDVDRAKSAASSIVRKALGTALPADPVDAVATYRSRVSSLQNEAGKEFLDQLISEKVDPMTANDAKAKFTSLVRHLVDKVFRPVEEIVKEAAKEETGLSPQKRAINEAKGSSIKVTDPASSKVVEAQHPEIASRLNTMGLTVEQASNLPAGEEVILSDNSGSIGFGGGGRGTNLTNQSVGGFARAGGIGYGMYMMRQMFGMATGQTMADTERYAHLMSNVGNLALYGSNTSISATDAGYVARQNYSEAVSGRANYQNFGAYLDIPYQLSGMGDGAARMGSTLSLAGGIAGASMFAPAVLGGLAQFAPGVFGAGSALAGLTSAETLAAIPGIGVALAGVAVAGTGLMEIRNAFNPNEKPWTYGTPLEYIESNIAKSSAAQRYISKHGLPAFDGKLAGNGRFGMPDLLGTYGLSDEQLKSEMRPQDLRASGLEDNGAEIDRMMTLATNLAQDTGESYDEISSALSSMQRRLGKLPSDKRVSDFAMEAKRSGRRSTVLASEADQYASGMGLAPGTEEFNNAFFAYGATGIGEGERDLMMRKMGRTSGFASQISGFFDDVYAGGNIARESGMSNQLQASNTSRLLSSWSNYRGAPNATQGQFIASIGMSATPSVAASISTFWDMAGAQGMNSGQMGYIGSQMVGMSPMQTQYVNAAMSGNYKAMDYFASQGVGPGVGLYNRFGQENFKTNGIDYLSGYNRNAGSNGLTPIDVNQLFGLGNTPLDKRISSAFLSGGMNGVDKLGRDIGYESQMASSGIAMKGVQLQEAYMWGSGSWNNPSQGSSWWLENQQRSLGHAAQEADFSAQYTRMNVGNQYAIANENIQGTRMQSSQAYNLWNMDFERGASLVQRGYTKQQWQLQDTSVSLHNQWNLEDINEQIRYSTGRERRLLVRQKGRIVTEQNLQGEEIETSRDAQKASWSSEDERYKKSREYQLEMAKLDRDSYNLNKKQRIEMYDLDVKEYTRKKKEYEEQFDLETKSIELNRKYQYDQLQLQKESIGAQAYYAQQQHDLNEKMITAQLTNEKYVGSFDNINAQFKIAMDAIGNVTKSAGNPNVANTFQTLQALLLDASRLKLGTFRLINDIGAIP